VTRRKTQAEQHQEKAHALLLEWSSGPGEGVPEDGNMHDRVQGGERPMSHPEKYAHRQGRWHRLDTAVQRTHEQNQDLGRAIFWLYGEGLTPRDCVGRMTGKDPRAESRGRLTVEDWHAWKSRRQSAASLFLWNYHMLCAQADEPTTNCAKGVDRDMAPR